MLDTHQLNVFLTAAETLNFTQAAQRLHMTQPSVSQHIQSLEQHFGMPLFVRSGRTVELSDAGLALVPLARELVNQSIHLEEAMASLQGEVHGHLQVGCSTTPGKYVLPHLLAEFHRSHPRVTVTCQVRPQADALDMLCAGQVHFALASAELERCTDVEFRKFMSDPVHLIAQRSHPWAQRESVEPEELLEGEFIFREAGSGTMAAVWEALARIGLFREQINPLMTLGNSEAIALAVQEGLGVGFVSDVVVTRLVLDRVVPIRVRGLHIQRDIYIGRHNRRPATQAQKAFWEFIQELPDPSIQVTTSEETITPVANP